MMRYIAHYFYNEGAQCAAANMTFETQEEMNLEDVRNKIIEDTKVDSVVISNCRFRKDDVWESMFV